MPFIRMLYTKRYNYLLLSFSELCAIEGWLISELFGDAGAVVMLIVECTAR